jgi:hypothetical protein
MKVKVVITYTTVYETDIPDEHEAREEWLLTMAASHEYQVEPTWSHTAITDLNGNEVLEW